MFLRPYFCSKNSAIFIAFSTSSSKAVTLFFKVSSDSFKFLTLFLYTKNPHTNPTTKHTTATPNVTWFTSLEQRKIEETELLPTPQLVILPPQDNLQVTAELLVSKFLCFLLEHSRILTRLSSLEYMLVDMDVRYLARMEHRRK